MGGGGRKRGPEVPGKRGESGLRATRDDADERGEEVRGPFEMFERSHRRLEEQLSDLQHAAGAIVRAGAGVTELAAVDAVIAYLEQSAAQHEQDEDQSLFPRLRRLPDLAQLLGELSAEQVLLRHLVKQLRSLRRRWPAKSPSAEDGEVLAALATELARLYRSHIEREERDLLPKAREHIGQEERNAMQMEMDRRRGVGERNRGRNGGPGGRRRMPAGSTGPRIREC